MNKDHKFETMSFSQMIKTCVKRPIRLYMSGSGAFLSIVVKKSALIKAYKEQDLHIKFTVFITDRAYYITEIASTINTSNNP